MLTPNPYRSKQLDLDTLQDYTAELQQQYLEVCSVRDELEASRERYRFMFQQSPVGYLCLDGVGLVIDANDRALDILGQPAGRLRGVPGLVLFTKQTRRAFASHIRQVMENGEGEVELELANPGLSGWQHVLLSSVAVPSDTPVSSRCQSALINITELKRTQQRLEQTSEHMETLAHRDSLTGLPNRLLFMDRLQHALAYAEARNLVGAVIFFDLDRFKVVNDWLGHDAGDELLKAIAQRLREVTRPEDTAARLGGDEFTVLVENIANRENAQSVAAKLLGIFERPLEIGCQRLRVTSSVGICLFRGGELEAGEILRRADVAMYAAKASGGACQHLFDAADDRHEHRHALETQLFDALDGGQFRVVFQPQYAADGSTIEAHEALVRWHHPQRGMLLPGEFVPQAEESGLITKLGLWVLQEACRRNMAAAKERGFASRIAVNVSPLQLAASDLVESVEAVLDETGHPAELLELEITETAVMSEPAAVLQVLDRLRALGVSIAVDDFGTGYSSLVLLKRFPLNRLKIDMSFVQGIEDDPSDQAIAQAIISLSQKMSIGVVAEGVETKAQFDFLRDAGCELYQGYLFATPGERLFAS
ncbi:MAG: EAL domain-containing protein [Pseudomonadota bacterium]